MHLSKTLKEYQVDQEIVIMKIRDINKLVDKKERKRSIKEAQECEKKGDYFWRIGEHSRAIKFFEQMIKLAQYNWKLDTMVNSTFKHGMHLA